MVILRIHDLVAQVFENPVCGDNGPSAIRSFEEAINNPESRYHKWPNDFELVQVGHYESNSPNIYPDDPPIVLVQGANIASALATEDAKLDLAAAQEKAQQPAPIRN